MLRDISPRTQWLLIIIIFHIVNLINLPTNMLRDVMTYFLDFGYPNSKSEPNFAKCWMNSMWFYRCWAYTWEMIATHAWTNIFQCTAILLEISSAFKHRCWLIATTTAVFSSTFNNINSAMSPRAFTVWFILGEYQVLHQWEVNIGSGYWYRQAASHYLNRYWPRYLSRH